MLERVLEEMRLVESGELKSKVDDNLKSEMSKHGHAEVRKVSGDDGNDHFNVYKKGEENKIIASITVTDKGELIVNEFTGSSHKKHKYSDVSKAVSHVNKLVGSHKSKKEETDEDS
jgi:hypothetical protein